MRSSPKTGSSSRRTHGGRCQRVGAASSPGETVYVLPTYTAMLELREVLRQDGHVAGFWQDWMRLS